MDFGRGHRFLEAVLLEAKKVMGSLSREGHEQILIWGVTCMSGPEKRLHFIFIRHSGGGITLPERVLQRSRINFLSVSLSLRLSVSPPIHPDSFTLRN